MSFSAIGMKAPGFASAAPAPTTAITGESDTLEIWSTMAAVLCGLRGRRSTRATQARRNTAAAMSTIATQVFGLDGSEDAAASPSTKAATTPIPSVAISAPR